MNRIDKLIELARAASEINFTGDEKFDTDLVSPMYATYKALAEYEYVEAADLFSIGVLDAHTAFSERLYAAKRANPSMFPDHFHIKLEFIAVNEDPGYRNPFYDVFESTDDILRMENAQWPDTSYNGGPDSDSAAWVDMGDGYCALFNVIDEGPQAFMVVRFTA